MATNLDPKSPSYSVPLTIGPHHLRILPASKDDVEEVADAFWKAFERDTLFKAMNGTADPVKIHENTTKAWAESWDALGSVWYKIVDEDKDNKIAAIAKWGFPHTPLANPPPPPISADVPGENISIKTSFFDGLLAARAQNWEKESMYLMNILAVRPEYQRLGLGRQLLAPVLKLADAQGRKAYIEASEAGIELYRKFGWREMGAVEVDLRDAPGFEERGVHRTVLMVREPGAGGPGL